MERIDVLRSPCFPPLSLPESRRDPVADLYHGTRVEDPYRWLEDPDAADTLAWTAAQNARTRAALDGPLRERLREELRRLYDYPRSSAPVVRGSRYFFTRNSGLQNQPVLFVQDGLTNAPRVLLDPNTRRADGTVALTAWEPSADGRLLAYALSDGGSDRQDVFVRDVESAADRPDRLRWAKFVTLSWNAASTGFYYTRYPEPGSVPAGEEHYRPAVYFHALGDDQAADRRVFGPENDPEIVFEVDQSSDHGFLVITAFKGASEKSGVTVLASGKVVLAIPGFDDSWAFIDGIGSDLYFLTDRGAPRSRLVAIGADGIVREIVAEGPDRLVDARVVGGRLAALYLHNASSRLALFEADGTASGEVRLPALGSITELTGEADGNELFARFASFTWPPAVVRHSLTDHGTSFFAEPASHVSPGEYEVAQAWYPSRDGTRISMFLVHRAGLRRDRERPVWLTAYGGFNVNVVPDFDPAHFVWLRRGGVLAVPNLRGGGEYGEAWHEAGMRERKQNVFDDCIAAAEWLIAERYTRPGRLVFEGGSNGGLLVAAVLTQRPDLPGAVVCRVPVADMLRYHLFTVGRFWIPEYGCADDPADFGFLYRYSPLHVVRDEVRYPPVLITTAETDDRVHPGMARKLTARLQAAAASSGGGPVLIRVEGRAGHGAGKPVAKMIEEDADIYTFALNALDLK
jgi:prolyl oligopeptidase